MTVLSTRLLLGALASGGFPAPKSNRSLTSSPDGGWTQIPDPKAFYFNGATYFAWIDGVSGSVEIGRYVHSTGAVTTATVKASFELDNHASPSVIVRTSDSKIVVAASGHTGSTPFIWISQSAEAITGTWTEVQPDASIGAEQYTYMTLYQMSGASDAIYLFYRDYVPGTSTGRLGFSTSADGGATWAGRKIMYTAATGFVPYWRIVADWNDRIDVFVTDKEPTVSKLGHFYFVPSTDKYYSSAGVELTAWTISTPLVYSDITEVNGAVCWSWGGCIDSLGRPATILMQDVGGTDNAIKVARWRSGAWQMNTVVASVGGQLTGNQYGSGCGIHHTNPDIVYVARKIGSRFEMFRYVSPDDGVTWQATYLTSGSSVDNVWADVVHKAATGLEGFWLAGTYTNDTTFAFGVKGHG